MKTEIIRIAGNDYPIYKNPDVTIIPGDTIATMRKNLKAIPPPRGSDAAMALLVLFSADGTLSSAGTVPTTDVFFWKNTDASDDNGTTILLPGLDCTLTDTFTIPTADGATTADATVDSNEHIAVGDTIYIGGIGSFVVTALTGSTTITVVNNGLTGNTAAGQTAASGVNITRVPATGPAVGRWMQASALT